MNYPSAFIFQSAGEKCRNILQPKYSALNKHLTISLFQTRKPISTNATSKFHMHLSTVNFEAG